MKPAVIGVMLVLMTATAAAGEPPSPLAPVENAPGGRWGYAVLSDDSRLEGRISTTPGKPIRIFDRKKSAFRDVSFEKIQAIEQAPDREWLEQEWRWKESGSDEKVFTGRFYRAAEYRTTVTLATGEQITGDAVAPIVVKTGEGERLLGLHKRLKGEFGRKEDLKPLVYIKKLVLTDQQPKASGLEKQEEPAKEQDLPAAPHGEAK